MSSQEPPAAAGPGHTIGGRYLVERILGRGGFGVVFLARALHDGRRYALKTSLRADDAAKSRFRREADLWITMGAHPNIVQAHFVDDIDGSLLIGMEYVAPGPDGSSHLGDHLRNAAPGPQQCCRWMIQLCRAMEFAASRGLRSHRDLKPANILIDPEGQVKVTDFGLASQLGLSVWDTAGSDSRQAVQEETMRGLGFGTPTHMPPEQFQDAAGSDARTDIYSAGVILYQLAYGSLPVSSPVPPHNTLEARLSYWTAMESAHRSFVHARTGNAFDALISRCTEIDAVDRYASFAELRGELERVARRMSWPIESSPVIPPPSKWDLINRATSLQRLGSYNEALALFEEALAEDGTLSAGWNGAGVSLSRLGRHADAAQAFGHAIRLQPGNIKFLTNRGTSLQALGEKEKALEDFDAAIEADPTQAGSWSNRGSVLFSKGDYKGALESYQRALGLEPKRTATLYNRGRLFASLGRLEEAISDLEAAVAQDISLEAAHFLLGACYLRAGQAVKACGSFARVKSGRQSLKERASLGTGFAYLHLGDRVEARKAFGRAAESASLQGDASIGLSLLDFLGGRFLAALHSMERAVDIGSSIESTAYHALCLHTACHFTEAVDIGKAALGGGHNGPAAGNLGTSLIRLSRLEDARDLLEWEASARSDLVSHFNLGVTLALQRRFVEAQRSFGAAIEVDPHHGDSWHNRAACLLHSGSISEAATAMRESRRLATAHPTAPAGTEALARMPDGVLAVEPALRLRQNHERAPVFQRLPLFRPALLQVPRLLPVLYQ